MLQLISMIGFPLLIFSGGIIYWRSTREVLALVLAIGMLPTLVSLTQFFWGPSSMVQLGNGTPMPDQSYIDLAQLLGMFVSVGTLTTGIAFVLLAYRVKSRAKNVT